MSHTSKQAAPFASATDALVGLMSSLNLDDYSAVVGKSSIECRDNMSEEAWTRRLLEDPDAWDTADRGMSLLSALTGIPMAEVPMPTNVHWSFVVWGTLDVGRLVLHLPSKASDGGGAVATVTLTGAGQQAPLTLVRLRGAGTGGADLCMPAAATLMGLALAGTFLRTLDEALAADRLATPQRV